MERNVTAAHVETVGFHWKGTRELLGQGNPLRLGFADPYTVYFLVKIHGAGADFV